MVIIISLISSIVKAENNSNSSSYKHTYNIEEDICLEQYDPYEKINRKIFNFNLVFDHHFLRPITLIYRRIFSDYSQERINNFIDNMFVPITTINSILQLDGQNSLLSFWQFTVNFTLGIGGIYDISSKFGLQSKPRNFGSTLARYGIGPGPYIVLPFFGGSSIRDVADLAFSGKYLNPLFYHFNKNFVNGLYIISIIQQREKILDTTDFVFKNSIDPYSIFKNSIYQEREANLNYPKSYRCYKFWKKNRG